MDLEVFDYQPLRGGFFLLKITVNAEPKFDAVGRRALARTSIVGTNITIELAGAKTSPEQISISIYHEVLEAATVGAMNPPASACGLNEAGFEAAAVRVQATLGMACPASLNQMLEGFGF